MTVRSARFAAACLFLAALAGEPPMRGEGLKAD